MKTSGLFFIDKPIGITSRDVDFFIMKKFGTKKVGHLGTLDPFASGLLIVAMNEGTKLLSALTETAKTYEAELVLGTKTDSGDLTGEVVETQKVPPLDDRTIKAIFTSSVGKSWQTPPAFSAVKVKGRPLYSYARNHEKIQVEDREVEIKNLALLKYYPEMHTIHFFTTVSKGTYIRSLGEDLAQKLGTVGHLKSLRRLAIDNIMINSSFISTMEESKLISIKESAEIFNMPIVVFADTFVGQSMRFEEKANYVLAIEKDTGNPIAIYYRVQDYFYKVQRGINSD